MEQLTTRTAKLIPRPKKVKKVPGFATSYHFETDRQLEVERGNLYVVIEVLTGGRQAEAVADLVIETIGDTYFNSPAQESQNTLSRFEDAVKATNQALVDYTNEGNAGWVGRLSAVIAVLCGEELHLTQAGSADAYLYRGNLSSHITADLQPNGLPKPINTFSNIASGSVLSHDRLIIGTPALFHQVNRTDLKALLTDSTANGAIQKISDRVGADDDADRIAAIVIEITTPEMLAMSTLPDEPEEIHLGRPDTPLDVAKTMAAPAAMSVANKGKAVSKQVLKTTQTTVLPLLRNAGLAGASWLRKSLKPRRNRQIVAAGLAVILLLSIWSQNSAGRTKAVTEGVQQYVQSYQAYRSSIDIGATDKAAAKSLLEDTSDKLTQLANHKYRSAIDKALAKRGREADDPSSIVGLKELITAQINVLDGIVSVQATVLADLSGINFQPVRLDVVGDSYVMADQQGGIATYSSDKPAAVVANKPDGFGSLVATTASSANDGIYLLTDEPSVWFFNLTNGSIEKQNAALEGWPKGKSIASYGGNLYILADDSSQVWRHVKTSSGFGARTAYFSANTAIGAANAMAVDGSIYLAGNEGINRFTRGTKDMTSTDIPDALKQPIDIVAAGTTIITLDGSSKRIGIFTAPDNTINYSKQITLKGVTAISSIRANSDGTTVYAISGSQLVSASY